MNTMLSKTATSLAVPHLSRRLTNFAATRSPMNTRKALSEAHRIVIKVGTAVVSKENGSLALSRMASLVEQIKELEMQGREVLLVSSGAVGVGRQLLGVSKQAVSDPNNVVDRQACAAVGQGILIDHYNSMFDTLGLKSAQVLITQTDFADPTKHGYLDSTLKALAASRTIPIINENDVVTGCQHLDAHGQSCFFCDNDMLAALVARGASADAVAMLSDVDGVLSKPPGEAGSERIRVYTDEQNRADVQIGDKSAGGRGGMGSKIHAACNASRGGVNAVVANGMDMENIERIFAGDDVGTLFPARSSLSPAMLQLTKASKDSLGDQGLTTQLFGESEAAAVPESHGSRSMMYAGLYEGA